MDVLHAALALAVRAPSVHNCQPWRFLLGDGVVQVYLDGSRQLPATDPHGRDLLISCGAVLHHLLLALAGQGWGGRVRRFPDQMRPGLVAAIELTPRAASTAERDLLAAIPRRHTDRRRFTSWPVPAELIGEMIELAATSGVTLQAVTEPGLRWRLSTAIAAAAAQQEADPAYAAEIARWSGRPAGAVDGVPSANAPAPERAPGRMPMRAYAEPALAEHRERAEPENAALLLLSTVTDSPLDWLRAGEVTSAVLLTATRDGLATSPLTQPLEVEDTRAFVRERVSETKSAHPQILLRTGWAPTDAEELPPTPRRPLAEVVTTLPHRQPL
jgi:nitroreductase